VLRNVPCNLSHRDTRHDAPLALAYIEC